MLYDHENGLDEIDMYVEDTGSNAAGPRDGYEIDMYVEDTGSNSAGPRDGYDEGVYSDHRDY